MPAAPHSSAAYLPLPLVNCMRRPDPPDARSSYVLPPPPAARMPPLPPIRSSALSRWSLRLSARTSDRNWSRPKGSASSCGWRSNSTGFARGPALTCRQEGGAGGEAGGE